VDLDAGDRLTAVLQNSGNATGVASRGDRVRLLFARKDCRELADEPTGAHSSGTDTTVGRNGT
jgi:DNA-binding sugar fermentation-stimulating protein